MKSCLQVIGSTVGDDAAGLAISENERPDPWSGPGRKKCSGLSPYPDGRRVLNEVHSILQRMRELAVQSSTPAQTMIVVAPEERAAA